MLFPRQLKRGRSLPGLHSCQPPSAPASSAPALGGSAHASSTARKAISLLAEAMLLRVLLFVA